MPVSAHLHVLRILSRALLLAPLCVAACSATLRSGEGGAPPTGDAAPSAEATPFRVGDGGGSAPPDAPRLPDEAGLLPDRGLAADARGALDSAPLRVDASTAPPDGPAPPTPDATPPAPDAAPPKPDLGPVTHRCADVPLAGATAVAKYDGYFNARGRPQTDQDMGWTHDPTLLDVINTVRFGDPPAALTYDTEGLRDAVDFIPEHHNQTAQKNYTLFKTLGLTDSPDAYAKFNPRDFIPASLTRYGHSLFASQFVKWSANEWTKLALARCPDCIDGIVTLSAVPAEAYAKHHDFFRIFEVRFVTDRAVYAATPAARMQNGDGRLFVSKPFRMVAVIDSSGSLYTHITTKASTFFTAPANQTKIRYRGEVSDPIYNVVQSGDISVTSPYRTGMVAVLMRYAEANDLPRWQVCDPQPIPAGTDMTNLCELEQWGTWRCGPYASQGRDVDQICKQSTSSVTGFSWLINHFVSCAVCNVDALQGCLY